MADSALVDSAMADSAMADSAMAASTFTYTLIPCDASEPLREFTLPVPPTLEENIGCLTSALNDHYRRAAPLKGTADKQAIIDSVKQQLQKNQPNSAAPDESILGALAESQTVDIVQLVSPTQSQRSLMPQHQRRPLRQQMPQRQRAKTPAVCLLTKYLQLGCPYVPGGNAWQEFSLTDDLGLLSSHGEDAT